MSKRAIVWVIAYCTGIALSVRDPIFALLSYMLDYYAHPPLKWWGEHLPDLRWSLVAGLAILGAYLLKGGSLFDRRILGHPQTKWLLALVGVTLLVTPFAQSTDESMHYVARLARLVMLYLLIVGVVKKPEHFRWVVLLLVLGSLTWGIDAFIDPDRRGGRLRRVGGTDSLNDNSAAAQLLIVLPFIALYFLRGRLWEKGVALVTAPFVVNTIILCNSRGATLAAGVAAATALTLVKGKLRLQILGAVIAAAVMAYALVDPQFVQRQMTLTHEEDQRDTSSQDRLTSWKAALHLIQDHPFGAGGGGFELLSPEYIPDIVARHGGELRSVHNTYLAIATDWGLPGFACFAMFLYTTFRALRDLRRRTRDPRIYLESAALQLSLTAFLAAAMFLNRQYAEALYWMAALSTALVNIQRSVEEAPAKARAPAAAEEAGAERAEPVDAR